MEEISELFTPKEVVKLFEQMVRDKTLEHPMPWTVESDRGCYIADAKGNYVVSQGIHPDLAEKFIQLAETYVKDGEKFTREFEVEQELPPGTLSNVGKGT